MKEPSPSIKPVTHQGCNFLTGFTLVETNLRFLRPQREPESTAKR
jgi:hypothetical protein